MTIFCLCILQIVSGFANHCVCSWHMLKVPSINCNWSIKKSWWMKYLVRNLLTLIVVSLFVIVVKERLFHVNSFTSSTFNYKYQQFYQIAIMHFDLDKNVETSQMLVTPHLWLVLILLGRFVHKQRGDVHRGYVAKQPTTF